MRNLDKINSPAKSTRFIFSVSLVVPIFMGFGAWALATGAAPELPLRENYLGLLGLCIALTAIATFPIPYIFRWNWECKYFGAGMLSLSSGSIVGIYPILCIARYSSLPALVRVALAFAEALLILGWCFRFKYIYRYIYLNESLFRHIYIEDQSAVYYLQRADKKVIEELLRFEQFPHSRYFILATLIAVALIPFARPISQLMGVPFIHVFLAVISTPLNMMFLGLATKGWLVFYFYPMKIKRQKNKRVYVDMSSQPPNSLTLQHPLSRSH